MRPRGCCRKSPQRCCRIYTEFYGNPSSIHRFGSEVGQKIAEARAQVAALIGAADPVEVLFTSCGTEGDNAAIRGMLEARPDKRHIVTTKVEHPAVLGLCQHLEKKGYRVTWLGVDQDGALDLAELSRRVIRRYRAGFDHVGEQ